MTGRASEAAGWMDSALLTVAEMREADRLAIAAGTPGIDLMEAAGEGCAQAIRNRFGPASTVVLAGPGNNGGDGFVVARRLAEWGWPVTVALLGELEALKGDARLAAERWGGPLVRLEPGVVDPVELVVDALFGAGLSRDLDGVARAVVERCRNRIEAGALRSVAIDVPSGVDGDSGAVRGTAAPAALTVTFFRLKPGHLLLPGRTICGPVELIDIGIPDSVLEQIAPRQAANRPAVWRELVPAPSLADHKYTRGHAVVVGGAMTGAARLAARAARRAGAGLLTVAADPATAAVYAGDAPGVIVVPSPTADDFASLLSDRRKNAVLVGPGNGVGPGTRRRAEVALEVGRATVLDADALTVFAGAVEELAALIGGPIVITPHEGEFSRLFPDLAGSKLDRARAAAASLGAIVVLKGADTVIAAPDGRALINDNAPPWLATGGTGDVLAGTVLGLLACGMPAFEAAAAAVWINGRAAARFGRGLIAEDLPELFPAVFRDDLRDPG